MLIFVLIDFQYLQNVVFSFEKGSVVKITPPQVPTKLNLLSKMSHSSPLPHPPRLFEKPLSEACRDIHWVMVLVQSKQHNFPFKFSFWYIGMRWYRLLPPTSRLWLPPSPTPDTHPNGGGSASLTTKMLIGNLDFICPLLKKLLTEKKEVIIMGDYNINILNSDVDNWISEFLDTVYSNLLFPPINTPTCISTTWRTLIDNMFYNDITKNIASGNSTVSISDQ